MVISYKALRALLISVLISISINICWTRFSVLTNLTVTDVSACNAQNDAFKCWVKWHIFGFRENNTVMCIRAFKRWKRYAVTSSWWKYDSQMLSRLFERSFLSSKWNRCYCCCCQILCNKKLLVKTFGIDWICQKRPSEMMSDGMTNSLSCVTDLRGWVD